MNERDILAQKDFAVKEALARGLAEGEARGEAKGEAKGEAEGKRETAKNLLSLGLPLDKIAFATGLSIEEVQRL